MTTRKSATKRTSKKRPAKIPPPKRPTEFIAAPSPSASPRQRKAPVLKDATLMHLLYHPERGIVRANVQQDVTVGSITERQGRDVDIALDELSADIRAALEDAFKWVAEDVKAQPYEPEN